MTIPLFKLINNYILDMKITLRLFLSRYVALFEVSEIGVLQTSELPESPYQVLSKFLRSSHALVIPEIFSSDNSLLSCYVYGDDIYDLIQTTKMVTDRLLLDERMNHDEILNRRQVSFVKSLFIGRDGSFPDVSKTITELRQQCLRLAEGLELRYRNPDLGVHSFQNLATATMVFQDLDIFFKENYIEYRHQHAQQDAPADGWSR